MDIAIVTGAETPLGQRITERLIEQGCRVHGIGNNFSKVTFADPQFKAHAVDLTDLEAVRATTQAILDEEKRLHVLVHAIDVTPGTAFRKLPLGNLEAILKIGLMGPVMLTRMLLPNLMRFRGQLINIIPTNKSGHEASAINALIEGGLRSMNNALFDQARDSGLRITNLLLRQNTELPAGSASDDQIIQSRIDPEDVANTVERLLDPHTINVPNEISLYPQLSAQAEAALPETPEALDPYAAVILPPKEYFPPKPEPIETKKADSIQRVIPYTDDEMEEMVAAALEDYESNPERYKEEMRTSRDQQEPSEDGQGGQNKKRRRRRGGRNRNKNRGEQQDENTLDGSEAPRDKAAKDEAPATEAKSEQSSNPEAPKSDKPKRRRGGRNRNRERKPRNDEGEGSNETEAAPQQDGRSNRRRNVREKLESQDHSEPKSKSEKPTENAPAPAAEHKPVKKKAAKKKTAKKAAKKAAKATSQPEQLELSSDAPKPLTKKATKKAARKAPAKKAAKKAAKKKTATKKSAKKSTKKAPEAQS